MKITVPGEPVPKARPRMNRSTGTVYTPRTTRAYEEHVAMLAMADGQKFYGESVTVTVRFFLKGCPKVDADNLLKGVLDGLNKSGIWFDDSQVNDVHVVKHFNAAEPRAEITVESIEATD